MIWSMIVYLFAVIGLVALVHSFIGWLFENIADDGGRLVVSDAEESLELTALKLKRFNDEVDTNMGQSANEIAWQEHCKSHNLKG